MVGHPQTELFARAQYDVLHRDGIPVDVSYDKVSG